MAFGGGSAREWQESAQTGGMSNHERQSWRDNYNGGRAAGDWTGNHNRDLASISGGSFSEKTGYGSVSKSAGGMYGASARYQSYLYEVQRHQPVNAPTKVVPAGTRTTYTQHVERVPNGYTTIVVGQPKDVPTNQAAPPPGSPPQAPGAQPASTSKLGGRPGVARTQTGRPGMAAPGGRVVQGAAGLGPKIEQIWVGGVRVNHDPGWSNGGAMEERWGEGAGELAGWGTFWADVEYDHKSGNGVLERVARGGMGELLTRKSADDLGSATNPLAPSGGVGSFIAGGILDQLKAWDRQYLSDPLARAFTGKTMEELEAQQPRGGGW